MKILSINITGLYGYLNKDITFNDDINLIVGINGSGKTSILNLINWMLLPSIPELCLTEFQSVELIIKYNGKTIKLRSTQDNGILYYFVDVYDAAKEQATDRSEASHQKLNPLRTVIKHSGKVFPVGSAKRQEALKEYDKLLPDDSEVETWQYLVGLPKPLIIGLERDLVRKDSVANKYIVGEKPESEKISANSLASLAFREYQVKILSLNNMLKDKLLRSAFEPLGKVVSSNPMPSSPPISLLEIQQLEARVVNYIGSSFAPRLAHQILANTRSYFGSIKIWIKKYEENLLIGDESNKSDFLYQIMQYERIKKLIVHFEEHESLSAKAYTHIKEFLFSVNKLMADSEKELFFERRKMEIAFKIKNSETARSIECLSSGEKQLVILFTHLCFNRGNVFIIDEPELSLHPKWQAEILNEFIKLIPKETQLIMATHSAALVGKNVQYCKVLYPYNS